MQERVAQAVPQAPTADVKHAEPRHQGAPGARLQFVQAVTPPRNVGQGLQRGRCAAEHRRDLQQLRALARDIAGRIAQSLLLLERSVVFLVNDDQAEVVKRGEYRRSRSDEDPVVSRPALHPRSESRAIALGRMQCRRRPESSTKARERLGSQTDLRHQDQNLPAAVDDLCDNPHVDLGFAAAGDTVEQMDGAGADGGLDCGNRRLLFRIQRDR